MEIRSLGQVLEESGEVVIRTSGTSMEPLLHENESTVLVRKRTAPCRKNDVVLFIRPSGQYVLHRIVKVTGDTYTCIGDNQFQQEKGLTHDQMIGVVTALYRGEKRWEADCWQYKLYCRVWHYTRFPRKCWRGLRARVLRLFKK